MGPPHWTVLRAGASRSGSAYKQAGAERRSDLICRKVAGEGLVASRKRSVTMVECTISTRVDGDALKVFWELLF